MPKRLKVTRTIIVTDYASLSSYEGMTEQEAVEYEKQLGGPEVIEMITGILQYYEPSSLTVTVEVEDHEDS